MINVWLFLIGSFETCDPSVVVDCWQADRLSGQKLVIKASGNPAVTKFKLGQNLAVQKKK